MITKSTKHDNEQVYVDYEHTNAHGQPALKLKHNNKWIQWVSKKVLLVNKVAKSYRKKPRI